MFLATTYSPRPAPTGATPQASPDRVVTLLTDDERMSSPTHRRRDYPRFTEAPISHPGSCPTPMTLRAPPPELGVTTAVREGPSNSPGRADVPIPSSAAAPPQIPTVLIPGSDEFGREITRWAASLPEPPALPDDCIPGRRPSGDPICPGEGQSDIPLAVTSPASERANEDQLGGNRDVASPTDADQLSDADSQSSVCSSEDAMAQVIGAIQSSHGRCSVRRQIAHLKLDQCEVDVGTLMGDGTFGEVSSASLHHGALESTVVVKRVYRDDVTAEDLWEAIDLMAHCEHPHVCGLVGYFETTTTGSPSMALVLERASRSLFSCLHEGGRTGDAPMPDAQVLDWSLQIASGLRYLKEDGGVYLRNLNSQNVLIFDEADEADDCYGDAVSDAGAAERQILKISDYCSTLMFDHGLPSSQHIHKVAWMAPEVLNCKRPGHPADSWSMGVLMWEMLTAKLPFGGCDVTAMFSQICEGNTAALALPAVRPAFWGKILAGCWHFGPKKRTAVSQLLVVLGKHYSELQTTDFSVTRSQSFDPDEDVIGGVPVSRHDYHLAVRQASENKSLINRASKGVSEFMNRFKSQRNSAGAPPHGPAADDTRSASEGARHEQQSALTGVTDAQTPWELSAMFGALNRRDAPVPGAAELTRRRVVMAGTGLVSLVAASSSTRLSRQVAGATSFSKTRKLTLGEVDFLHKANHSGRHKPLYDRLQGR